MGGSFPQNFIDAVRDAADIVQVVSEYVPLKRSGARYKGRCPFHQEKTPSFSVDPDQQLFYCFGCQTGGDLFKFVMLYEKLGFPEAVEMLAQRFGIPLPRPEGSEGKARKPDERERLLVLNAAAADFFRSTLAGPGGARGREYLERRGITPETAERLGIGYAPESWDALLSHLRSRRFSADELHRGGLVLPRKSGDGHYDRFRDRLMFPIRNPHGKTVAFGGRALGDAEPKYINSPETPTYTKGDQLYGLDLAREGIRREGFAVVVEGYLDLAALLQAGVDAVVASLGTAFTPAQVRLLARYTDRVLVSYDGDAAGAEATTRSLDLLLERGMEVRVVELPAGQDPDDFVREHGAEAYQRRVREAPEYLEFLIRRQAQQRDRSRIQDKVAGINAVLPHLAKLQTSVERAEWAARLADALGVEDELVLQELRNVARQARGRVLERPERPRPLRWNERTLVRLALDTEAARQRLDEILEPEDLAGSQVEPLIRAILRVHRERRDVSLAAVHDELEHEAERELLAGIAFRSDPVEGTVDDCLWACRRERLHRAQADTVRRLNQVLQSASPGDDVNRMLSEIQDLARQRDTLH